MKCQLKKLDGSPCGSNAMTKSHFCYFHNPAIPEEKKKTERVRGGRNNAAKVESTLCPLKIKHPADVVKLITGTIDEVRSGKIDVRVANCLGFLSTQLLKALETAEFEERLSILEKKMRKARFQKPCPHRCN